MKELLISSIVLTYNAGASVIRTLDSIREQTYKYKDLVISDDCSSDNGATISIINSWLEENRKYFSRIQFLQNSTNVGIIKHLKKAASYTSGDIIFALGQGDTVYGPDTFTTIAFEINKQANNDRKLPLLWFAYYQSYSLNPHWHMVQHHASMPFQLEMLQNNPSKALRWLAHVSFIGGASIIYHRDYFNDENFPLPTTIRDIEDYSIVLWMLANNCSIEIIPLYIRWYEIRAGISCSHAPVMRNRVIMATTAICDWAISTFPISLGVRDIFRAKKKFIHKNSKITKALYCPIFTLYSLYILLYTLIYAKLFLNKQLCKIKENSGITFSPSFFNKK